MLSKQADEAQTSTNVRRSAMVVSILLGLAVVAVVTRSTSATPSAVLTKNMSEGRSSRVRKDAIDVLKDDLESRMRAKRDCLKKKGMLTRRRLSWQAYIDTQLLATGQVEQAAILSKADGSTWAASKGFKIGVEQITVVNPDGVTTSKKSYNEPAELAAFAAHGKFGALGCYVGGVKYQIVRTSPDGPVAYGKRPKGGICIAVTNQAIIIGTYNQNKGQAPGLTNTAVENLANYLRDSGYLDLMGNDDPDC